MTQQTPVGTAARLRERYWRLTRTVVGAALPEEFNARAVSVEAAVLLPPTRGTFFSCVDEGQYFGRTQTGNLQERRSPKRDALRAQVSFRCEASADPPADAAIRSLSS